MPSTSDPSSFSPSSLSPSSLSPTTDGAQRGAGLSVVALGGGSGLAVLLRGLKNHSTGSEKRLTAVVTVADDGGSSGRLRRELGVLPPGDIRNCIVALADDEDLLARLFQYRFPGGRDQGLSGHSFGNLFLTALAGVTGDFYQAIVTAESILSVRGRILPATLQDVVLRATGQSGRCYEGESAIGQSGERLRSLELAPAAAPAFPPAVEALETAGVILLGPGSLYTSLLPNLLITGIRGAVARSPARAILVQNIMTQPGETSGMSCAEHLRAFEDHLGSSLVDVVLVNSTRPPEALLRRYSDAGSELIEVDDDLRRMPVQVEERDLLSVEDGWIRHDPAKLANAVMELARPS